ncbi:MAG: hydantoinase B/oxoprolinase family protein, partial [Methyloceanibacter sp.]
VGDRLIARGPSGGGYGDPKKRSPEAVLVDVLDGSASALAAQADYAVALRGEIVDTAQTAELRGSLLR